MAVSRPGSNPKAERFHVLDSWRGICALCVVLFHARYNAPVLGLGFVRGSWQFVDFFFVLSGFVIAANYRATLAVNEATPPRLTGGHFVWLRLARIYPLHLFMLLAFIAVEAAGSLALPGLRAWWTQPYEPSSILSNLLLVQSLGIHGHLSWNQPAWSIATEFWCYLLFLIGVRTLGHRLEGWLVAVVMVAPLLLLIVTDYGINVTYDWGMLRNIYGFSLGVLCWAVWQRGPLQLTSKWAWTLIELATIAAVVAFVALSGVRPVTVLGPPLFAVAVLVFAHARGALSKVLEMRFFLLLGTLSYSIYLIHTFILARFRNGITVFEHIFNTRLMVDVAPDSDKVRTLVGSNATQGTLLLMLVVVLIIGASWLSYRLIERPAQKWLNARWPRD